MAEQSGARTTRRIRTSDGMALAWDERGNPDGPVIVAVHGYPDDRTLWHGVAARLADRFRVVTYDVRGAGESDVPTTRGAYRLDQLADDLRAVLREAGRERPVHLLAHDWGSIQCWHALTDPTPVARVASYTSISGPCLDHVGEWVRGRLRRPSPRRSLELVTQLVLSSYIGFFRMPRLPELAWERGVASWLISAVQRCDPAASEHPTRPSVTDGLHGLNLYRANMLPRRRRSMSRAVEVPVQVLAPTGDPFVSAALQTEVDDWAADLRTFRVPGGHWTPRTRPDVVARHVADLVEDVESRRAAGEAEAKDAGGGGRESNPPDRDTRPRRF